MANEKNTERKQPAKPRFGDWFEKLRRQQKAISESKDKGAARGQARISNRKALKERGDKNRAELHKRREERAARLKEGRDEHVAEHLEKVRQAWGRSNEVRARYGLDPVPLPAALGQHLDSSSTEESAQEEQERLAREEQERGGAGTPGREPAAETEAPSTPPPPLADNATDEDLVAFALEHERLGDELETKAFSALEADDTAGAEKHEAEAKMHQDAANGAREHIAARAKGKPT